MTRNHDRIVVGVDGSERALTAVRFAAHEARRSGLQLVLVHVTPDYVPMSPMLPLLPGDLSEMGTRLLAEAAEAATGAAPDVPVSSRLLHGGAAWQLVGAAEGARMVVLGRETTPAWARVFTGAVTMGVAARAECPVVSVPDGWAPDDVRARSVVVGFEAADLDVALLEHALVRAGELGARLTVLHAWELPGLYDDIIVRRTHDTDWNRGARERIEEQVARMRPDHPGVEVSVEVLHRQPALALREASETAGLLILGRHGQRPMLRHLGGTARALLREASCAVEIVPPVAVGAPTPAPAAMAEAGETLP